MSESSISLCLVVNGRPATIAVDSRSLLVEAIRDALDLKATHIGCRTGDCGACTVYLDGEIAKSCLCLAVASEGRTVITLEGQTGPLMKRLQSAFVARNAFQCGFCTAGMLMVAADLLRRNAMPNAAEARAAISGNLCRCTGYEPIVAAILDVAGQHEDDQ